MFTVTATALTSFLSGTGLQNVTGTIRCVDPHGSSATYDRPFEVEIAGDAHGDVDMLVRALRTAVYEQAHFAADFAVAHHGHKVRINEPDAAILVLDFDFDHPPAN